LAHFTSWLYSLEDIMKLAPYFWISVKRGNFFKKPFIYLILVLEIKVISLNITTWCWRFQLLSKNKFSLTFDTFSVSGCLRECQLHSNRVFKSFFYNNNNINFRSILIGEEIMSSFITLIPLLTFYQLDRCLSTFAVKYFKEAYFHILF